MGNSIPILMTCNYKTPDDLLKSAIFEFCKNLKENNKKKIEDETFEFEMKYKDTKKYITIEIDIMGQRACTYVIVQNKYSNYSTVLPIYNGWNTVHGQIPKLIRGIKAVLEISNVKFQYVPLDFY